MQHKYEDPVPEFNGDFSYGKVYTAKSNKGIELLLVSVQDVEDEIAMITKQAGATNISTSFRRSFRSFVQQTFCNIDNQMNYGLFLRASLTYGIDNLPKYIHKCMRRMMEI